MSEAKKNHKRTDEELVCDCSHLYHDHTRKYDFKTRTYSFGNLGPCNICTCQAYKDITTKPNLPHLADINKEYHERNKAKYQKQVDDAIQATSPNTPKLEAPKLSPESRPSGMGPEIKLIFEDRFDALVKFFECQNVFECRAVLSVPYNGKELPAWIECPLCHSTMYAIAEISSLKGE